MSLEEVLLGTIIWMAMMFQAMILNLIEILHINMMSMVMMAGRKAILE